MMFTADEREQLRSELLTKAADDRRITGAAITGSAATGREDEWSDIDLAFGVGDGVDVQSVLADWTGHMYAVRQALDHFDVIAGAWTYRVFLLANSLQVDLAFVPAAEFRPLAASFRLVFGSAHEERPMPAQQPRQLIGLCWLYALHARSSIARGKFWQAEQMVSGVRDYSLELACVRHGLPAMHGRAFDLLPAETLAAFEGSLVRGLDAGELLRSFGVVVRALIHEIDCADVELAARLKPVLLQLSELEQH